jgi:integrase
MATKRAKTFDDEQFKRFLKHIDTTSLMPIRDRLIVMLSFRAGLRVGEIAKIKLSAMTDVEGRIAKSITVFSDVAKKQRQREVPMNDDVRDALKAFRRAYPNAEVVAISSQPFRWLLARKEPIPKTVTFRHMSVNATKLVYSRLLDSFGYDGASTHSGRRTFGTELARSANFHHCSLRDVQRLMGHSRLETTEHYIELSEDATSLVKALGRPRPEVVAA